MIHSLINILSYLGNYLLMINFIAQFIKHKLSIKQYILMLISISIISIFISTIFFNYIELKSLIAIFTCFWFCRSFYHCSYKKTFLCMIIYTIACFLSELFCVSIFALFTDEIFLSPHMMSIFTRVVLAILANITLYCLLKIFLFMTHDSIQFSKKYLKTFFILLFMMIVSSYLAIYCTITNYSYFDYQTPIPMSIFFVFIFILWIILIVTLMKEFKTLSQKIKQEIMIEEIMKKYNVQIESYIKEKDSDIYQYLRHDIINYIQTYTTLQHKGDHNHDSIH